MSRDQIINMKYKLDTDIGKLLNNLQWIYFENIDKIVEFWVKQTRKVSKFPTLYMPWRSVPRKQQQSFEKMGNILNNLPRDYKKLREPLVINKTNWYLIYTYL